MSEKLCALRKIGGGTLKETTLWTNPSPTSAFNTMQTTLDGDPTDYLMIKIIWRVSTSDSTEKQNCYESTVNDWLIGNTSRVRNIAVTGTSAYITTSWKVDGTGAATNTVIPIKIIGLK